MSPLRRVRRFDTTLSSPFRYTVVRSPLRSPLRRFRPSDDVHARGSNPFRYRPSPLSITYTVRPPTEKKKKKKKKTKKKSSPTKRHAALHVRNMR